MQETAQMPNESLVQRLDYHNVFALLDVLSL